jgi:hypothetical protein
MCENLTEITIPESVTTLGVQAFAYCTKLQKAYVRANITDLPYGTFINSVVSSGTDYYTNTALTEVYLSATITKIHSNALYGNYITDIYYAGSLESWNDLYFYTTTTDENGQSQETKVEKSDLISTVLVHTSYNF